MRVALLLLVTFAAVACDDGSSRRLVSSDVGGGSGDGCVVSERRRRAPRTWLVRDGDSLRRIARKMYGDEKLWKAIADANPGKVGDGGVISPGVELTVPFDGI